MGGYNSGGGRGALRTGNFWHLDISRLQKIGALKVGWHSLTWSSSQGTQKARIELKAEVDRLILSYNQRSRGETQWEQMSETIFFDWTEQKLGGERVWFLCPRCRTRCRVLFGRRRYLCRGCQQMTYESQYDTYPQLPWSRAHRMRERLGGEAGFTHPFPSKPKGMHWKTYYRLRDEDDRAEELLCYGSYARLQDLRARIKPKGGC